jgi:hypothetical protein
METNIEPQEFWDEYEEIKKHIKIKDTRLKKYIEEMCLMINRVKYKVDNSMMVTDEDFEKIHFFFNDDKRKELDLHLDTVSEEDDKKFFYYSLKILYEYQKQSRENFGKIDESPEEKQKWKEREKRYLKNLKSLSKGISDI